MRSQRTRRNPAVPRVRSVLTATAIAALVSGGSLALGGTAAATTHQADTCTSSVNGAIGEPVAVQAESLRELVKLGAREAGTLAIADLAAHDVAKKGSLEVGQVANEQESVVSGEAIGDATVDALNGSLGLGLNPGKTLDSIKRKVAGNCAIPVQASNFVVPSPPQPEPAPGGAPDTAPTPTEGGTGGDTPTPSPSNSTGSGDARAPQRSYDDIPVVPPGVSAPPPGTRYPGASPVPGMQAPQMGDLDGPDQQQVAPQPDVRNAGNADALAAPEKPGTVELPMLLAVVALAGVSAALVRTWVVRRAP